MGICPLEAVLDEVRRTSVDRVVVGGDVLPGPMPRECLDVVMSLEVPTDFIIGNGDRERWRLAADNSARSSRNISARH